MERQNIGGVKEGETEQWMSEGGRDGTSEK